MNRRFKITILVVLLITLSVILWSLRKAYTSTDLQNAFVISPVNQTISHRIFRNIDFELLSFSDQELYNPQTIFTSFDDGYIIVDYGDNYIKTFSADGIYQFRYGRGTGRGPGEVVNLIDVNEDDLGRIWATDSSNSRITIFERDGEFEIFPFKESISRAMPLGDGKYFIKPRFSSTPAIANIGSNDVESFPSLVDDPRLWSNVLGFFLAYDGNDSVITVHLYTNDFVKYNLNGNVDYFRRPVNPPAYPAIIPPRRYSDDQTIFFNEIDLNSRSQRTMDVQIFNGEIHLLIDEFDIELNEMKRTFIDVYSLENGNYLHSYKLPAPLIDFSIRENRLAGLTQDSVGVGIWSVENGW